MTEIGAMTVASSLSELHSFASLKNLDMLSNIGHCFWNHCNATDANPNVESTSIDDGFVIPISNFYALIDKSRNKARVLIPPHIPHSTTHDMNKKTDFYGFDDNAVQTIERLVGKTVTMVGGKGGVYGCLNTLIKKATAKQSKKKKRNTGAATAKGKTTTTWIRWTSWKSTLNSNATIWLWTTRTNKSIKTIELSLTERGYNCVYLPPYSPELNPIEQFWSKLKYTIKREELLDVDTLFSRISEACNMVTHKDLHGYIRHSISCFDDCLNGAPI
ncbi:hypothetical protein EC973_007275 [Apophysomyces ossiformis]|uniref:Tc1-like transposase DDE domain-containing protein n=1 Tax=Apophysomyces ossiformis TaxID=679940 RepID=A0A8H7BID6_9FUNG|nr:hypothetical protein EC973_007275 [Apophysomyces ossiformis]